MDKGRWSIIVSAVTAAWTVLIYFSGEREHAKQQAASDALRAQQTQLSERLSRETQQIAMLPNTITLLREQKCDSDFVVLVLLDELRGFFQATDKPTEARIGIGAQKAALRLLIARQTAGPYCSCPTLLALEHIKLRDAELADLAADLAQIAAGGVCASNPHAKLVLQQVSANALGNSYYVVFGNDTSCDDAQSTYGKTFATLQKGVPTFDKSKLKMLGGRYKNTEYLVTVYGGDLSTAAAGQVIAATQSTGARADTYWSDSRNYHAISNCAPPTPEQIQIQLQQQAQQQMRQMSQSQ